jgi:hypothetical protein
MNNTEWLEYAHGSSKCVHKYLLAELVARNSSGIFLNRLFAESPQSQPTVV